MAPIVPTIIVPPVQSSTPPVVLFGLLVPPPLLAPTRIWTAVKLSAMYPRPLAAPAMRSPALSLSWVP